MCDAAEENAQKKDAKKKRREQEEDFTAQDEEAPDYKDEEATQHGEMTEAEDHSPLDRPADLEEAAPGTCAAYGEEDAASKEETQASCEGEARSEDRMMRKPYIKKTMCKFYSEHRCDRSLWCEFAHCKEELGTPQKQHTPGTKIRLCKHWHENGNCPHAERCEFAHGDCELGTQMSAEAVAEAAKRRAMGGGKGNGKAAGKMKNSAHRPPDERDSRGSRARSGGVSSSRGTGGRSRSRGGSRGTGGRSRSRGGGGSVKNDDRGHGERKRGRTESRRSNSRCSRQRISDSRSQVKNNDRGHGERKRGRSESRRSNSRCSRRRQRRSDSRSQVHMIIIQTCSHQQNSNAISKSFIMGQGTLYIYIYIYIYMYIYIYIHTCELQVHSKQFIHCSLGPGPIWAHLGPLRPSSFGRIGPDTYLGPGPVGGIEHKT